MKKILKIVGIILAIIVIIGIIFFAVDYSRANDQKSPIFCINTSVLKDGGTKEYIGLGYKVIEYCKIDGYDKIHIGTWLMKYDETLKGCNLLDGFPIIDNEVEEKGYKDITPEEAKIELDTDNNIILLDVRTQEEYDGGHIPKSILIPVSELENRVLHELTDKEARIFVYCAAGARSLTACEKLVNLGYTNVYHLGGIVDWKYEIE